jgi:hypothetical protein
MSSLLVTADILILALFPKYVSAKFEFRTEKGNYVWSQVLD